LTAQGLIDIINAKEKNEKIKGKRFNFLRNYLKIASLLRINSASKNKRLPPQP